MGVKNNAESVVEWARKQVNVQNSLEVFSTVLLKLDVNLFFIILKEKITYNNIDYTGERFVIRRTTPFVEYFDQKHTNINL